MKIHYKCPFCDGFIDMDGDVIFGARNEEGEMGLIALHQRLGDYTVKTGHEFYFKEGGKVDFYCPICHADLKSKVHNNLALIRMVDEKKNEFSILFSQVAGEKSTYKIIGETMDIFGDDSAEYLDFINLSMNF